jgi:hypothetical protein
MPTIRVLLRVTAASRATKRPLLPSYVVGAAVVLVVGGPRHDRAHRLREEGVRSMRHP